MAAALLVLDLAFVFTNLMVHGVPPHPARIGEAALFLVPGVIFGVMLLWIWLI